MTGVRVEWCNFWSKAYALDLNHPHSVLIYFISNTSCHSIFTQQFWRGLSIVESYLSKNESSAASYRRQHWIHFFWVKSLLIPDSSCHSRHILSFKTPCHSIVIYFLSLRKWIHYFLQKKIALDLFSLR